MPELLETPYLLTLEDSHPRKNREAAFRVLHRLGRASKGLLVMAEGALSQTHLALANELGVQAQIREVVNTAQVLLNALYAWVHALLLFSYAEGFGWPVIESQQCGCPMIWFTATSLPEVLGEGAILCGSEDISSIAGAVKRLGDQRVRCELISAGRSNLDRLDPGAFSRQYLDLYHTIVHP